MPGPDPFHQFFVHLDSVDSFDRAFERRGADTGMFFRSQRKMSSGERVSILVHIKGVKTPVVLEGRVVWRRVQDGGPSLQPGVFVGLVDRDRARLDAIVRYLRKAKAGKDRRSHFRYPVYLPASYRTAKGTFPSETRNLSRGGAFLRCMGPLLTVGSRFPVVLFPEGEENKGVSLDVQVAWIDYFEDTQGMGVVFEQEQASLKKVYRLLDRVERNLNTGRDEEH